MNAPPAPIKSDFRPATTASLREYGIARGSHFALILVILALFPFVLRASGALSLANSPQVPNTSSPALLRFCVVVSLYLWFTYFAVIIGVRVKGRANVKELLGLESTYRSGWYRLLGVTFGTFLILLLVGIGTTSLFVKLGFASDSMQTMTAHTWLEAGAFLATALSAGFIEEVVFHGYIQRQLTALTGNVLTASILQVCVFTLGHLYQGWVRLIPVFLIGCVLTAVAVTRKSLVPGMLAHAAGDSLVFTSFLVRVLKP